MLDLQQQGVAFPEEVSPSITEGEAMRVVQDVHVYNERESHAREEEGDGWWDTPAASSAEGLVDSWTEVAKASAVDSISPVPLCSQNHCCCKIWLWIYRFADVPMAGCLVEP